MEKTTNEQSKEKRFTINEDGTVTVMLSAETAKKLAEIDTHATKNHPLMGILDETIKDIEKADPRMAAELTKLKEEMLGTIDYSFLVESLVNTASKALKMHAQTDDMPEHIKDLMKLGEAMGADVSVVKIDADSPMGQEILNEIKSSKPGVYTPMGRPLGFGDKRS